MRTISLIRLAAAGILLCSCQSDSYKIKGFARDFQQDDTVILALENHQDRILGLTTVSDGVFSLKGTTDTIVFCRAYMKKAPLTNVSFFLEPGNITIELSPYPKPSRVSGTLLNNDWQSLNDKVQKTGSELIRLAEKSGKAQAGDRLQMHQRIDSLHREISASIKETARQNKTNALGRYIEENYKAPEFR